VVPAAAPVLALALALAAAPALALAPADLLRCRALGDDRARLACYDALPVPAPAAAAQVSPPAAAPAALPALRAATSPAAPEADFGRPAVVSGPQYIESRIDGPFEGWDRHTRIRLANGQVWQVTDGTQVTLRLRDPVVRVRRGALGSFLMEFEGSNRSVRVRRVD
jgi:hypothetical protein